MFCMAFFQFTNNGCDVELESNFCPENIKRYDSLDGTEHLIHNNWYRKKKVINWDLKDGCIFLK